MAPLGHGLALWCLHSPRLITCPDSLCREPGPDKTYDKVEIADVGYVRNGHFCRLFNAALPSGHVKNARLGAPNGHIPLELDHPVTFETQLPARRALWGSDVKVIEAHIDVSAALYVHSLTDQSLK